MELTKHDREVVWLTVAMCIAVPVAISVEALCLLQMHGGYDTLTSAFLSVSCGFSVFSWLTLSSVVGMMIAVKPDERQYPLLRSRRRKQESTNK